MIVGLITARNGSKGIPGKNMVDLGGKPLIEHSFAAFQNCPGIDRAFLSTDIPEAIELARAKYPRIEIPFVRPPELCEDNTAHVEVVEHFLNHIEMKEKCVPEAFVLIQPTSPFRRDAELAEALQVFKSECCESLLGVTRVWHHPADYLFYRRPNDSRFNWVMRSKEWKRRQDFPEVFFNSGALYICSTRYFRLNHRFFDEGSRIFKMSEESAMDIDTPFDLAMARGWLTAHKAG